MTQAPSYDSIAVFAMGDLIGDALNKLPFMRGLRAAFPQAHITWITARKSVYARSLKSVAADYVDEVRELSGIGLDNWWPIHLRPSSPRRYALLIDLQPVLWRTLAVRRLPHDVFISSTANFLFSDVKPPRGWVRPEHMTDRLMEFLRLAAGEVPVLGPANLVKPEIAAKAARALPGGPAYVGFAPGAGARFKRWPLERFIEVARDQAARGRVPVFIIGPNELDLVPDIRAALPQALFPEQMSEIWGEEFSPLNTIAIGQRLAGALTNDSGVSHMLGAADAPMLTLYGRTNALKFRPRSSRGAVMTAAEFGSEQLTDIPVAAVVAALESVIAGTGGPAASAVSQGE